MSMLGPCFCLRAQVLAYGAAGTGKTSVLGMRRVFAGGVFSMAVQSIWRELAAAGAHSRVSIEVLHKWSRDDYQAEPALQPCAFPIASMDLKPSPVWTINSATPVISHSDLEVNAGIICGAAREPDPRPIDRARQ